MNNYSQHAAAEEAAKQTRLLAEINRHAEETAETTKKTYRLLSLLVILFVIIPFFAGIFFSLTRCAFSSDGRSSQVSGPIIEEYEDED